MILPNETQHSFLNDVEFGVGTWAWGDQLFWGYGKDYKEEDLRLVFDKAVSSGIRFFDTAEGYGQGKSESLLGKFIQEVSLPIQVATKFMPYPWRLNRGSLTRALKGSLKRLGLEKVNLYQIHMPLPPITIETWMEALSDVHQAGLTDEVGVSNYSVDQMMRAYDALIRQGVNLVSNQVEYHLLNRKIENNGMLEKCRQLGIKIIAYSPLGLGLLTGKYNSENPPGGIRGGRFTKKYLAQIQPLIHAMRKIGAEHDGKNAAQVAINWVQCKGAIPIPGAKTFEQIDQNLGAIGWRLSEDEIGLLDEISKRVTQLAE
jgi:aryl-alcohol dehydrogenase-like predicted oxidoreductase